MYIISPNPYWKKTFLFRLPDHFVHLIFTAEQQILSEMSCYCRETSWEIFFLAKFHFLVIQNFVWKNFIFTSKKFTFLDSFHCKTEVSSLHLLKLLSLSLMSKADCSFHLYTSHHRRIPKKKLLRSGVVK